MEILLVKLHITVGVPLGEVEIQDTMYIHIRNGNNESLFNAPRVLRGSKGSGASMAIRVSGPTDQSAPGVVLVNLGF